MKKFLLSALALVAVAALAITGTIAYLQFEDEDVNVMTLGNVKIDQLEYERIQNADGSYEMVNSAKYGEGYKLKEFTQDKPLYPATGEITGWGGFVAFDQLGEGASGAQSVFAGLNNVVDKFVLVKNTGTRDAYVRTYIALEYGSNTKDIIGISTGDFWNWTELGIQEIDGNNYYVYEAVYQGSDTRHVGGVLPAGEYTYNSLGQVYLKNEATNDDVENLDGNKNGMYDILVLSQACQVAGFENAADAFANMRTNQQENDAAVALDTVFGAPEDSSTIDNDCLCADWFEKVVPVESGICGGIMWTLTEDGTLTVAPSDTTNADVNCGKTFESGAWREAVVYNKNGDAVVEGFKRPAATGDEGGYFCDRNAVKSLVIKEGVASIGSFAAQFPNLTGEVVIPSTVTYIGQEAFTGCKITKLTFAEGGTEDLCIAPGAFKRLKIEDFTLPADRPAIHVHCWVLNDCTSLKSVTFPANVTTFSKWTHVEYIGDMNYVNSHDSQILARCNNLETITFGSQAVRDLFFAAPYNTGNINAIGNVNIIVK